MTDTPFIKWLYLRDFGEQISTERIAKAYEEYTRRND